MNDIIEISSLDDNFDSFSAPKSSNFGSGIELLMNDKMKDSHKPTSDIDLDDINNIVSSITEIRIANRNIKATINNPESSRGHLFLTFEIQF